MIPTYNCATYLRQTLESVLLQAPGADQMQIEVVDDCSTKDDPERVVREIGGGRVNFFRKANNGGAISNFNTCIERSTGQLIHILHGDDYLLPGFYSKLEPLASPSVALIATRCFFVDEESHLTGITSRLQNLEVPSNDISGFHLGTPLQFAGVVVRRSFYEQYGGFATDLVHTADWEMWSRAICFGKGTVIPHVGAAYRIFSGNDTARLMRTAENLRDRERIAKILMQRDPKFQAADFTRKLIQMAKRQELQFRRLGDQEAVAANRSFWIERESMLERILGSLRRGLHFMRGAR